MLREALKSSYTKYVAHHLIPLEALDDYLDLLLKAAVGGFDLNGTENGKRMLRYWATGPWNLDDIDKRNVWYQPDRIGSLLCSDRGKLYTILFQSLLGRGSLFAGGWFS